MIDLFTRFSLSMFAAFFAPFLLGFLWQDKIVFATQSEVALFMMGYSAFFALLSLAGIKGKRNEAYVLLVLWIFLLVASTMVLSGHSLCEVFWLCTGPFFEEVHVFRRLDY